VGDSPFPEDLGRRVDGQLKGSHNAYSADEGSNMTLNCVNSITREVMQSFDQPEYRWIHNGMRLKSKKGRMKHDNGTVEFASLKQSDSGSYLCQIEYEPYLIKTVGVYALLVMSTDPPVRVVEYGKRFCLQCNSAAIGHVFRFTKRNWILNNRFTMFSNIIPAKSVSEDCIEVAMPQMSGDWKCLTLQEYSDKEWFTAFYRIKVGSKPTTMEKFGKFVQKNFLRAVMFVVGVVLFFVSLTVAKIRKGGMVNNENLESTPLTTEKNT
jgi:hypothetical protein